MRRFSTTARSTRPIRFGRRATTEPTRRPSRSSCTATGSGTVIPICALRPTGVYGVARPIQNSKWHDLVSAVVRGETVQCSRGGKEVHAADVAKAAGILLTADGIAGQAFNCYDRYVSEFEVATLAKELSGSASQIVGEPMQPKHQIVTDKIRCARDAVWRRRTPEADRRRIGGYHRFGDNCASRTTVNDLSPPRVSSDHGFIRSVGGVLT